MDVHNALPEPKANEPECIDPSPIVGDENQGGDSLIKAPENQAPADLNFMLNRRSRSVRMPTASLWPQQINMQFSIART
jgi:hypothetical protein